ncbi:MAG: extracellular solute-binding protein [Trueperaceae bacterium]
MSIFKTFSRRTYEVFLVAAAAAFFSGALAQETVTLLIHPTLYGATGGDEGVIKAFTEETGIRVNVVTAPTDQLREKAVIEYVGGTGQYDVATLQDAWMNEEITAFLEPLSQRVEQLDESYDFDDLVTSLVGVNTVDGQLVAVPFRGGTTMLYYRTDFLEAAGVEPPQTIEELYEAAEALTLDQDGDGTTDVYGLVLRGKPGFEVTQDFTRILFANGGSVLTEDLSGCALEEPESVETIQFWQDVLQNGYIPPDTLSLGRDDQIRVLQTGGAAMGIYFSPYYGRIISELDPSLVGWAVTPTAEGVTSGRSLNTLWSLAIDRNSDSKDAAWQLVQWLTNTENQIEMAVKYANAPVRESTYVDESFIGKNPLGPEWLQATAASRFEPTHPRFPEIADIISVELTGAMEGRRTAEEAAARMCRQVDRLL